jgi:hypothetical protein
MARCGWIIHTCSDQGKRGTYGGGGGEESLLVDAGLLGLGLSFRRAASETAVANCMEGLRSSLGNASLGAARLEICIESGGDGAFSAGGEVVEESGGEDEDAAEIEGVLLMEGRLPCDIFWYSYGGELVRLLMCKSKLCIKWAQKCSLELQRAASMWTIVV